MKMSESIKNLAVALNKAQTELGAVKKGQNNPFFKSKYADINAVIEAIKETLNNNGISYVQSMNTKDVAGQKINVVETMLLHTSGEFIGGETEVVHSGNDPQKFGAAITYTRRFGLQSLVGLPAEDDDGNKATGKTKNSPAIAQPKARFDNNKKPVSTGF